jgi:hypothetical protein
MRKRLVPAILALFVLPLTLQAQGAPDQAGEVSALLPVGRIERGANPPMEARLQDAVHWRDWFETEARGRARLSLLDGSQINVGSEARFQVLRPQGATQQAEVELQFGKIRSRVAGAPGRRFEVRTDSAVVGVIGTHFYIHRAPGRTTVINFEGQVAVRNVDASVPGEETLEPFELAEVEPGQPPRKRPATLEEILRALEDTLPGPVMRLEPWQVSAGSCVSATVGEALRSATDEIARTEFFEVQRRPCAAADLTPLRVCAPPTAPPGVHEYQFDLANGTRRWGAFLVRAASPLEGARLVIARELPPGATHYARVVGKDGQPLAGVPVRIAIDGQPTTVETDANGGFSFRAPEQGGVEVEVVTDTRTAPPEAVAKVVVTDPATKLLVPDFSERGSIVTLPGDVRSVQLGSVDLPVARTRSANGRSTSSVAIPPDAPAGEQPLEIEEESGRRVRRQVRVYEILAGRLDQHALISGNVTPGEFLVCLGLSDSRREKLRARITAMGPVQFRGKGAKGKKFEDKFEVTSSGLLRIPFQIQAEKTGTSAAIPFTLTLVLSEN